MAVASMQQVATMTAREGLGITVTVDRRHPPRQQSGHDPPRFGLVVVELFPTVRRHGQQGLHLFGLVMRGMADTLTVMAMGWGVNDDLQSVERDHVCHSRQSSADCKSCRSFGF